MATCSRLIPTVLALSLTAPFTSWAKVQTPPSSSSKLPKNPFTATSSPAPAPNSNRSDPSEQGNPSATPSTASKADSNTLPPPGSPQESETLSPPQGSTATEMPIEANPVEEHTPPSPMPSSVDASSHQETELQTPQHPIKVHSPQFGMNVEKIKRDKTTYQRRQWTDMVRNDPELLRLHRTGRLVWPGGIITALGSAWLMLSIAGDIDRSISYSSGATWLVYRYVFPLAMIAGGIPMLTFGARARIKLHQRHVELMASPISFNSGTGQGGGAMIVGRF